MRAFLIRRLALLAGAIALGLLLQAVLRARLDEIAELSRRDMLAARAEIALVFRIVGSLVFGVTATLGVAITTSSRQASDPRVRLRTPFGVAIIGLSLAGLAIVWYAAAVLAACRA